MRLLMLTRYGAMGASSRLRSFQYIPWLEAAGWNVLAVPFFSDAQLLVRYQNGKYGIKVILSAYLKRLEVLLRLNQFDLVWIEKESLPWIPSSLERFLLQRLPYVLDFDDATFHIYDQHRSALIRTFLGHRLDHLMASSSLVVAGSEYLAQRAITAGAPRVEQIPTVVDLLRYTVRRKKFSSLPRIVWVGSPSTVHYLLKISSALISLSRRVPFTLRVIGGGWLSIPGVNLEIVPWRAEIEAQAVGDSDIGIMPLSDSLWEQGKCAYKLIQYMACGLPTVASPVGANLDVVVDNLTGYFATTTQEWVDRLECLLKDKQSREKMGYWGRERVESLYCLQQTAPKMVSLLSQTMNSFSSNKH